jgi:hypothetical protein
MLEWKFPAVGERVSIVGSTGSGKTRFANWLFAKSYGHLFKKRPHLIIDYKGDDLIRQIPNMREIGPKDNVTKPGLFVVRPAPKDPEIEILLWKIWKQGNVGIYLDEGYMLPGGSVNGCAPFNWILTQGRSLKIGAITLTQRPVMCSRFVFTEADYHAQFRLNDLEDQLKTIGRFTRKDDPVWNFREPLEPFHSRWYDVKRDYSTKVMPVPSDEAILSLYDEALKVRHRSF